ncbi:transglycosylase domain-containing protein [bacterium]|nr:transglycosylase domain-containing protein [bacterium]
MRDLFFKYWIIGLVFIGAGIVVFVVPPILHTVIEKKIRDAIVRTEKRINCKITLQSLTFLNTATFQIENLTIASDSFTLAALSHAGIDNSNKVLEIKKLNVDLYLGGFLTGRYVHAITIDSLRANVIRTTDSTNNLLTILRAFQSRPSADAETGQPEQKNKIAQFVDTYLQKRLPSFEIRHLDVLYRDYSGHRLLSRKIAPKPDEISFRDFSLTLRESLLRDAQFEMRGSIVQSPATVNQLEINGSLNHSKRQIVLNALFDSNFKLPFIKSFFDGEISLKGFDAQIYSIEDDDDRSNIKAAVNINEMEILSDAVSEKKLRNLNVGFDLDLDFGADELAIRPATRVYLNKITGFISGKIERLHGHPLLDVNFKMPMIPMNDFFSSVPEGLLTRIDGIKVRGSFEFEAALKLDFEQLDSIKYNPTLTVSDDFRVFSLGDSIEVKVLRDSFNYTFTREDDTDSTYLVGGSNPYFQPLDSIPPILINSVLFCEDNSFFKNDGFNVLQIGRSLRDNIREKKFARGASTISMQFVKNIFLSREKTISRKFQELILTWLFNHEKLLDEKRDKEKHKKRLLEIYLNIIEWGPDVHGVGRATEFYFRKKPKDLTVGESVFLATIIPNPKKYERYFEDGLPKKKHANFMNLIVKMLHEKDVIDSLTMARNLPCTFKITGEARRFMIGIKAADSTDTEQDVYYKDIELNN